MYYIIYHDKSIVNTHETVFVIHHDILLTKITTNRSWAYVTKPVLVSVNGQKAVSVKMCRLASKKNLE